MHYINEMNFLREIFKRNFVNTNVVALNDKLSKIFDDSFPRLFNDSDINDITVEKYVGNIKPETLYKTSDSYGLNYMYMLLPENDEQILLFIGPFADTLLSPRQVMEIAEKNGISPSKHKTFSDFYSGITIIDENNPLLAMVAVFCEKLWHKKDFNISDVKRDKLSPVSPINQTEEFDNNSVLIDMENMEKRYKYENEMMQAVSLGQMNKMDYLIGKFNYSLLKKRTNDTLRNVKNYCIIMNTLLRKAAQNGGVHPIYIDRVSSAFAVKIEMLQKSEAVNALVTEMFKTYCRLVRQHTMKNYSPIIQRTIAIIDSDISANLTLSTLARQQNLSLGYLSTVFKDETGKTLTEYIRDKRIKHAQYLLSTTHLQIQTVALHCGIMDVQYFSKIFKKQTGKTPKEYREELRFNR